MNHPLIPRILCLCLLLILPSGQPAVRGGEPARAPHDPCRELYEAMKLDGQVDYSGFSQALQGLEQVAPQRRDILTLIDFTKPSTEQRLYVLDLTHRQVLFASAVSHGRNSGENYATSFSNENGSHKSSLGFYLTAETYRGRNGYSLALDGLERGINDRARQRAIVIHGADYCNPSFIASSGRLGRSHGCPALPEAVNASVIDAIKGGTLLYIYARDDRYLTQSPVLGTRETALP